MLWHIIQAFIPAANNFDSTLFSSQSCTTTPPPQTHTHNGPSDEPVLQLQGLNELNDRSATHINTALPTWNKNAACDFTGRHFTSGCYCALAIKVRVRKHLSREQIASSTSAPSSAVALLLCFALGPQLQPGQVHGCYLNDVLILVKQFCV